MNAFIITKVVDVRDLGIQARFASDALHEHFFAPYWENIVLGRAGLMKVIGKRPRAHRS